MNKTKRMFFILALIITNFLLTSCWNYREINDMDIIMGAGIDRDKNNNKYIFTYETFAPSGEKGQMKTKIITHKGPTLFNTARKFVEKNGKVAYWAHTKLIVIGKTTAVEGIIPIVDYTMRDSEFRPDVKLLVSDEETASEIFLSAKKSGAVTSMKLDESLNFQSKIGTFEDVELWNFTDKLSREGFQPIAPLVFLEKSDGDDPITIISGLAVFKRDKMIGKLSGEETLYYLFIDDEIKNQPIYINQEIDGESIDIGLEIIKNKTNITPIIKEGYPVIQIDIKTDVSIAEIGGTVNVIEEKGRAQLAKDTEKKIQENIFNLISRVQTDYNSDIFGFGNDIKKALPKEWKKIGKEWDEYFPNLKVEVNSKVNITRSALLSEPIKIQD